MLSRFKYVGIALALTAVTILVNACGAKPKELQKIDLAFCSQVLCVLPFEVAKQKGFFAEEGLDVNLIYMKGGPLAVQQLVNQSIDFAGSTMDVAMKTTDGGKPVTMVTSTANLPFFALVTSPQAAKSLPEIKDLAGKKLGVNNLGATDHLLAQYLLKKNGVAVDSVEFVALGPNIQASLERGQVDAAMVQEPALTKVSEAGGRVLVNFMDQKDSVAKLGGPYQFMGLLTRPDVIASKPELVGRMARAMVKAQAYINKTPGEEVVKAAPEELTKGLDMKLFGQILDRVKKDLYPADGLIKEASVKQVYEVQKDGAALKNPAAIDLAKLYTNQFIQGKR